MSIAKFFKTPNPDNIPHRFKIYWFKLQQKLWFKPFLAVLLSVAVVFLAKFSDGMVDPELLPHIKLASVERLLSVIATSLLAVATFSVGSMVSAYANASSQATPRAFTLVISDDASQNTLSVFIGSFIFGVVGLVAVENGYFGKVGKFTLFVLTVMVFALVIWVFVRWIDGIARLGRMGNTIARVEEITALGLAYRRSHPHLKARPAHQLFGGFLSISPSTSGYLQSIDLVGLNALASEHDVYIHIQVQHGDFITPVDTLAYIQTKDNQPPTGLATDTQNATASSQSGIEANDKKWQDDIDAYFEIGREPHFQENPDFGLRVLSEIASKALSPGINDQGTAIQVIHTHTRLFLDWLRPLSAAEQETQTTNLNHTHVTMPAMQAQTLFAAAFSPIARDGATNIDVVMALLESLEKLLLIAHAEIKPALFKQAEIIAKRSIQALSFDADKDQVHAALEQIKQAHY